MSNKHKAYYASFLCCMSWISVLFRKQIIQNSFTKIIYKWYLKGWIWFIWPDVTSCIRYAMQLAQFNYHCIEVHPAADPGGHVVLGVGLQPLDCKNRGFESHWRHGCWFIVFVLRFVGSRLCNAPKSRAEESYRVCVCVCVCKCVWSRNYNNEAA